MSICSDVCVIDQFALLDLVQGGSPSTGKRAIRTEKAVTDRTYLRHDSREDEEAEEKVNRYIIRISYRCVRGKAQLKGKARWTLD